MVERGSCSARRAGCRGFVVLYCCRVGCMAGSEQESGGRRDLGLGCTGCMTARVKVLDCSHSARIQRLRRTLAMCSGLVRASLCGRTGFGSLLGSRIRPGLASAILGFFLALVMLAFLLLLYLLRRRQWMCWVRCRCGSACPSRHRPAVLAQPLPQPRPVCFAHRSSLASREAHPRSRACCAHRRLRTAAAQAMPGGRILD